MFDALAAARNASLRAAERAAALDADGAFPAADIKDLGRAGLLLAPFHDEPDRQRLNEKPDVLREVLTTIGRGSLALGRLYEGHINAVALTRRYGSARNLALLREEAEMGVASGVWMAGEPLRLERDGSRFVLHGRKILCSGAGHFHRPLVAAIFGDQSIMLIPRIDHPDRVDTSDWVSHGMRATATGTVDFTGIFVGADEIVGQPGDYLRSPFFRGGAWRVIAVQLGGLEAVMAHYATQLAQTPLCDHPVQLARFGEATIAYETARLWVERASVVAEGDRFEAEAIDAYVDLARNAFEEAALRAMLLAQKAVGLKAYLRPNPLERIIRDLGTYLRQPALDASLMSAAAFYLRAGQVRA